MGAMKTIAPLFLFLVLNAAAADPAKVPAKPGGEAETKAEAWLKELGENGLVLKVKTEGEDATRFVGRPIAGSKNTMFVFTDDDWYITLGFEGAVSEDTPLDTLKEKWSYIALDKVPTPGLKVEGWEIKPRTPVSSLRKASGAVEFLEAGDGRISIRVKTHFFALYGRALGILVPADAPMPPGTYFQIRQNFDLDLSMEVPFAMGK